VTSTGDALSDAELVRLIATRYAGDSERGASRTAEADLCRRFAPRIRLYGLRHLRDEDRARDLVQAVLLAVIVAARAGRVQDPEHFDRFVLGTCRNTSSRMREVEARATSVSDDVLDVATFLPEPEWIETPTLFRCLEALDPRSRRIVMLTFHDERSADQIATALKATVGHVRVLRHRALAALRKCLDTSAGAGHAS
jgi:RNA polymerase sigma-70 factor (ECF subfamily)